MIVTRYRIIHGESRYINIDMKERILTWIY